MNFRTAFPHFIDRTGGGPWIDDLTSLTHQQPVLNDIPVRSYPPEPVETTAFQRQVQQRMDSAIAKARRQIESAESKSFLPPNDEGLPPAIRKARAEMQANVASLDAERAARQAARQAPKPLPQPDLAPKDTTGVEGIERELMWLEDRIGGGAPHPTPSAEAPSIPEFGAWSNPGANTSWIQRARAIPNRLIQQMSQQEGRLGNVGSYIAENGRSIGNGFVKVGGPALFALGTYLQASSLHDMHKMRNQLQDLAKQNPNDGQIQEFFKLNNEATKRHDAYFGVNTGIGAASLAVPAAASAAASAGLIGGTAAAVATGPVGWTIWAGIGLASFIGTSLFESHKQKQAYREYLTKVYGNADHPSLDYYLQHKDPSLLAAVNEVRNYSAPPDVDADVSEYVQNAKQLINDHEKSIDIEMGIDDPRRQQLANDLNNLANFNNMDQISNIVNAIKWQEAWSGQTQEKMSPDQIEQISRNVDAQNYNNRKNEQQTVDADTAVTQPSSQNLTHTTTQPQRVVDADTAVTQN